MEKKKYEEPLDVASMSALIDAQKKQIENIERQLKYSQDKVLALNTLIDVAEEHGLKIRKKLGSSGRTPLWEDGLHRQVFLQPA